MKKTLFTMALVFLLSLMMVRVHQFFAATPEYHAGSLEYRESSKSVEEEPEEEWVERPEEEEKEEAWVEETQVPVAKEAYIELEPFTIPNVPNVSSDYSSRVQAENNEGNHRPYFGIRKKGERAGHYKGACQIANDTDVPLYIGFYLNKDQRIHCWLPEPADFDLSPENVKKIQETKNQIHPWLLPKDEIITVPPQKIVRFRLPYVPRQFLNWYTTVVCTTVQNNLPKSYKDIKRGGPTIEFATDLAHEISEHIVIKQTEWDNLIAMTGAQAINKIYEMNLPSEQRILGREIQNGYKIVKKIIESKENEKVRFEKGHTAQAISNVMYYLNEKAKKQGKNLKNGDYFLIEDPDYTLFNWIIENGKKIDRHVIDTTDFFNHSDFSKKYNTKATGDILYKTVDDSDSFFPWPDVNSLFMVGFHANKTQWFLLKLDNRENRKKELGQEIRLTPAELLQPLEEEEKEEKEVKANKMTEEEKEEFTKQLLVELKKRDGLEQKYEFIENQMNNAARANEKEKLHLIYKKAAVHIHPDKVKQELQQSLTSQEYNEQLDNIKSILTKAEEYFKQLTELKEKLERELGQEW